MKCGKKYLNVIIITSILLFSIVGTVSAMDRETYDKMSFWTKVKYNFYTGNILFFTSWGQANCCSEQPDKEKWIKNGDRIDCDDYCSYDKCAIDVWYDHGEIDIRTGQVTCPSGDPNWNNWVKEEAGDGEYFRGTSYHCYFVQVYCCPKECVTDDHETRVYVCENGEWDRKSKYGKDESCPYDRGCWCADSDDNKYYDETGNEHCRSSPRSSWCTSCTSHSTSKCYSNDMYWYDSCGNKEDKKEDCGTAGCITGSSSCESIPTECTAGQKKCVGTGATSNEVVSCIDGKWPEFGGVGSANCLSGTVCDVGDIGTSLCYTPSGVTCDYDLKCEPEQGETTTTCPTDCCNDGDDTCNYDTKEFYICNGNEWENQGQINGKCGYVSPSCHTGEVGSLNYCSESCTCQNGEGDCDKDTECTGILTCVNNVGANYGWASSVDVCESAPSCTSHDSYKCYNNDVYWYDSCGGKEEKKTECGDDGCSGRECNVPAVCNTEADTDCNGVVSRAELGAYINKWINGQVTRTKLGEAIVAWMG